MTVAASCEDDSALDPEYGAALAQSFFSTSSPSVEELLEKYKIPHVKLVFDIALSNAEPDVYTNSRVIADTSWNGASNVSAVSNDWVDYSSRIDQEDVFNGGAVASNGHEFRIDYSNTHALGNAQRLFIGFNVNGSKVVLAPDLQDRTLTAYIRRCNDQNIRFDQIVAARQAAKEQEAAAAAQAQKQKEEEEAQQRAAAVQKDAEYQQRNREAAQARQAALYQACAAQGMFRTTGGANMLVKSYLRRTVHRDGLVYEEPVKNQMYFSLPFGTQVRAVSPMDQSYCQVEYVGNDVHVIGGLMYIQLQQAQ